MSNYDEELKFWKDLLDRGEIDEDTYNSEISKINRKLDNKTNYKKYNIPKIIKSCLPALIPIILLIVMIKMNSGTIFSKKSDYGKKIDSIPSPVQSVASGKITKKIDDLTYVLTRVASYKISGRVVTVHRYYSSDIFDKISHIDLGLSWGTLARDDNNKKVTWWTDNRFLYYECSDNNWESQMGGLNSLFSNNHIIYSNEDVERQISSIKEGDFVTLTGYLVNITCNSNDGYVYEMKTSTSRNDTGDGACEILYVTGVSWLN